MRDKGDLAHGLEGKSAQVKLGRSQAIVVAVPSGMVRV